MYGKYLFHEIILENSKKIKEVVDQALKASRAVVSVLITGETGTGKEVFAHFIHKSGPRSDKPFVAINCGAIQATVLESELFGYEAGAFTGAEKRKHGLMEVADDGILFLDEISSMFSSSLSRSITTSPESPFPEKSPFESEVCIVR